MYSVLVGGQLSLIPTSDKAHFLAARFFLAFIWADIYHSPPHWVVKPRVNCALPHLHIYTSLTEGWGAVRVGLGNGKWGIVYFSNTQVLWVKEYATVWLSSQKSANIFFSLELSQNDSEVYTAPLWKVRFFSWANSLYSNLTGKVKLPD